MTEVRLTIEPVLVERFRADLDALIEPSRRIGLAVSGGPDSMALLLLAAAARPGQVEAATVDHLLRDGSHEEAEMVARASAQIGVPHTILKARWDDRPDTAIQEKARRERYRLLGFWVEERGLDALVTGHHVDDQAETVLMRLARGSGVRGLAGMHRRSVAVGTKVKLLRPLLGWRRPELEEICAAAGIEASADPSNEDRKYERVRVRRGLREADWLDAAAIARSAANLAEADAALDWAMQAEWKHGVREKRDSITYRPSDVPREILRRIAARAVRHLTTEGDAHLRGPELDRLLTTLIDGGTSTLRGVLCRGGAEWQFSRAPERR
ncbi:MAG: tRNA lysidine(34) synthetase TilS [Sphingomonas sp.]|nr:tRNA lysidine(34) synthetase TilS [Sphingomonas sp.]